MINSVLVYYNIIVYYEWCMRVLVNSFTINSALVYSCTTSSVPVYSTRMIFESSARARVCIVFRVFVFRDAAVVSGLHNIPLLWSSY